MASGSGSGSCAQLVWFCGVVAVAVVVVVVPVLGADSRKPMLSFSTFARGHLPVCAAVSTTGSHVASSLTLPRAVDLNVYLHRVKRPLLPVTSSGVLPGSEHPAVSH